LGELARLGVVGVAKGFESPFGRGEGFLRRVVCRLQLSERSVFLVTVIGEVFGFFDEFLRGAVGLVLGELQLLCERIQLELYGCLSNTSKYNKRQTHFGGRLCSAKFSELGLESLLVLPRLLETGAKSLDFLW
jgi:hypothetical protein